MSFLLDTNLVSEWVKPRPNSGVMNWMADVDEDRVFVSVVSLTELHCGIERMSPSPRRSRLNEWLEEDLPARFEGRILNIDRAIADTCGRLVANSDSIGRRIDAMDALIAATARVHQLTVVTRNTADFEAVIQDLFNPWSQPGN